MSVDFFEPWCSVPIQNCSYLVFADLRWSSCVVARRPRRYPVRIHSVFPSWIGRGHWVGQNAVTKIFLLLKRGNDRHMVGKNEEVSGLYHVLEMFHCFVNRQELPWVERQDELSAEEGDLLSRILQAFFLQCTRARRCVRDEGGWWWVTMSMRVACDRICTHRCPAIFWCAGAEVNIFDPGAKDYLM